MVWRLACMAQRFASSNNPTRWASHAVWSASTALDWNRYVAPQVSSATSFTRRWKGSLRIRKSVDFWYFLISRSATVPAGTCQKRQNLTQCYVATRTGAGAHSEHSRVRAPRVFTWTVAVWTLYATSGSWRHRSPLRQPHAWRFTIRGVATPGHLLGARHGVDRRRRRTRPRAAQRVFTTRSRKRRKFQKT